jgi:uncharacterized repeat protein (TIGR01451 family)
MGFALSALAATADAASVVLDPGPGTAYLAVWCGGQQVNEVATGFDAGAYAVTLVSVATTCHGSGRGAPNQYYLACWTVRFGPDGSIAAKEWLATNHWRQGSPAQACPLSADPAAVYTQTDAAAEVLATLRTERIGSASAYRAVLDTTCAPMKLGDAVSGAIGEPGAQACHSFRGSAGDGIRVDVAETMGDLAAVHDLRRPDGSLVCGPDSGSADCTLDVSGVHTVFVRAGQATGTGGYTLSLACLTPSCGAAPHLTIGMTATLGRRRLLETIAYAITLGNDGRYPASDVVVHDTLPPGLYLRRLSSSQGTCSQAGSDISCAIGGLDVGATATVNVTALVRRRPDSIVNTACVEPGNCATTITSLR